MSDTEKPDLSPEKTEEMALMRVFGRVLWRIDPQGKARDDEAGTKTSWSEGRRKYMSEARKIIRILEREGVTIKADPAKAQKPEKAA